MLPGSLIDSLDWLPPYCLRYSNRAKHLNFKICSRQGLQVIVPPRFNIHEIPAAIQKHRRWIERHWQHLQPLQNLAPEPEFPQYIRLAALNEQWQISYEASSEKSLRIKIVAPNQLLLQGNIHHKKLVKQSLQHWVKHYAKQKLVNWLKQLSQHANLGFNQVTVRRANTLWGSCNAKKRISLNCKLLFLPAPLVEYVILHELCHTIHLNHSQCFWSLLQSFVPDCLTLRKQLRQADHYIPQWFQN